MKIHAREYECPHCDFKCPQKRDMLKHMTTHKTKKHHSCRKCEFSTGNKSHMRRHMLTHTGGEIIRMYDLQQVILHAVAISAESPHENTHRRETICMYQMHP